MQNCKTLRQPLLGELAMSRKREERETKCHLYWPPKFILAARSAAHALRSDQNHLLLFSSLIVGQENLLKNNRIRISLLEPRTNMNRLKKMDVVKIHTIVPFFPKFIWKWPNNYLPKMICPGYYVAPKQAN